jgi:hypothetical protein
MTILNKTNHAVRGIAWAGFMTALGLGVSYGSLVAWGAALRIWRHVPVDRSLLIQVPWDPDFVITVVLIGGSLILEFLINGWRSHPVRRLLFEASPK